jgi:hypothetical protein
MERIQRILRRCRAARRRQGPNIVAWLFEKVQLRSPVRFKGDVPTKRCRRESMWQYLYACLAASSVPRMSACLNFTATL